MGNLGVFICFYRASHFYTRYNTIWRRFLPLIWKKKPFQTKRVEVKFQEKQWKGRSPRKKVGKTSLCTVKHLYLVPATFWWILVVQFHFLAGLYSWGDWVCLWRPKCILLKNNIKRSLPISPRQTRHLWQAFKAHSWIMGVTITSCFLVGFP